MQTQVDEANACFWNEMCGSSFAKAHGITEHDMASLNRFDKEYLEFYPYLLKHVPIEQMKGKNVLEVGLGYGTLGLKIAHSGANYHGLDIAAGPVKMMQHRLHLYRLSGTSMQGNMLQCPFADASMDCVVSIGCFHHTGDIQRCIDETYRILKKGGSAYIMVYNRRSYRQWQRWPFKTLKSILHDWNILKLNSKISQEQRAAYDSNLTGEAAPETVFSSIASLHKQFVKFSSIKCEKENCEEVCLIPKIFKIPRYKLLNTLGHFLGFDIYVHAIK